MVAGQDVEEGDTPGTWPIARNVVKARVISTVDPQTRQMHKSRSNYRDGYKAHLAVEPETGLITGFALTPANAGDGPPGVTLLDDDVAGLEVLGDSAYGSGPVRADLAARGHTAVIRPWPIARSPRLDDDQFGHDDFRVHPTARTVTCPNGISVTISPRGAATFEAKCQAAPSARAAPPTRPGRFSPSANTTSCSPPPGLTGEAASASTIPANGDRWMSVRSPGSWPMVTAVSATAASNATDSASASVPPGSTCAGCSTSASTGTTAAGPSPPKPAGPGPTSRDDTYGLKPIPTRPAHTLNTGTSVKSGPRPTNQPTTIAPALKEATCSAASLSPSGNGPETSAVRRDGASRPDATTKGEGHAVTMPNLGAVSRSQPSRARGADRQIDPLPVGYSESPTADDVASITSGPPACATCTLRALDCSATGIVIVSTPWS